MLIVENRSRNRLKNEINTISGADHQKGACREVQGYGGLPTLEPLWFKILLYFYNNKTGPERESLGVSADLRLIDGS